MIIWVDLKCHYFGVLELISILEKSPLFKHLILLLPKSFHISPLTLFYLTKPILMIMMLSLLIKINLTLLNLVFFLITLKLYSKLTLVLKLTNLLLPILKVSIEIYLSIMHNNLYFKEPTLSNKVSIILTFLTLKLMTTLIKCLICFIIKSNLKDSTSQKMKSQTSPITHSLLINKTFSKKSNIKIIIKFY
jgi:hypothetical protein